MTIVEKEVEVVFNLYKKGLTGGKGVTTGHNGGVKQSAEWWEKKFRIIMEREKAVKLDAVPLPVSLTKSGE
jgi:hypothetical protein